MTAGCIRSILVFLLFALLYFTLLSWPGRLRRALNGISYIELVTESERESSLLARYDYDVRKSFSDIPF